MSKTRLDILVEERGFAENRDEAQRLIMSGKVRVSGQTADKPGVKHPDNADIEVVAPESRYASRGGEKLAAALDAFPVEVDGRICLDLGASTGGFTSCLLLNGAAYVYAVDVGKGLLAWELRNDGRVAVMEGVNARYLDAASLNPAPTLLVVDLSFISLSKVLPPVVAQLTGLNDIICLVKPQFEAERREVGVGGVVTDNGIHRGVLLQIAGLFGAIGFPPAGLIRSPLLGPAGNVEFLMWGRPGAGFDNETAMIETVIGETVDDIS
ncbi:MAG: TlyA family RNA methyltransferase [bacterium]|nr:TlyA family RNA methyltransferase [bacterium]